MSSQSGPTLYTTTRLRVSHLTKVEIIPTEENVTWFMLEGKPEHIALVDVRITGDTLEIDGIDALRLDRQRKGSRGNVVIGGNVSNTIIVTGGGNVVISDQQSQGVPLRIGAVIYVPSRTPIQIADITDQIKMGDTEGPIDIDVSSGVVTIGRVENTKLALYGSVIVEIGAVNGTLQISTIGSPTVTIKGGMITNLDIASQGSFALQYRQ